MYVYICMCFFFFFFFVSHKGREKEKLAREKAKELVSIITDERLKPEETRKFIDNSFRDGVLKTTGTDIDKLMPPVSRFGDSHRAEKKQTIVERLNAFFERFFGIG